MLHRLVSVHLQPGVSLAAALGTEQHTLTDHQTSLDKAGFFNVEFIVLSQQLSGAAMVRRWSAYIHLRLVWSQVRGSCSRHRWEIWRTGQAGVFRKKLN